MAPKKKLTIVIAESERRAVCAWLDKHRYLAAEAWRQDYLKAQLKESFPQLTPDQLWSIYKAWKLALP